MSDPPPIRQELIGLLLTAQQSINGEGASPADEQSHGHEKKRQAILDAAALSRTTCQKETIFPVSLPDRHRHKNDQPQGERPREKPDEKGEAAEEFSQHPDHANGGGNGILLLPVGQHALQAATAIPTENLLRRVSKERDRKPETQKHK